MTPFPFNDQGTSLFVRKLRSSLVRLTVSDSHDIGWRFVDSAATVRSKLQFCAGVNVTEAEVQAWIDGIREPDHDTKLALIKCWPTVAAKCPDYFVSAWEPPWAKLRK